jgi:hypothetical protein
MGSVAAGAATLGDIAAALAAPGSASQATNDWSSFAKLKGVKWKGKAPAKGGNMYYWNGSLHLDGMGAGELSLSGSKSAVLTATASPSKQIERPGAADARRAIPAHKARADPRRLSGRKAERLADLSRDAGGSQAALPAHPVRGIDRGGSTSTIGWSQSATRCGSAERVTGVDDSRAVPRREVRDDEMSDERSSQWRRSLPCVRRPEPGADPAQIEYERQQREYRQQMERQQEEQQRLQQLQQDNARRQQEESNRSMRVPADSGAPSSSGAASGSSGSRGAGGTSAQAAYAAWEKRPPLAAEKNPLLGRWAWQSPGTKGQGGLDALVRSMGCGMPFGDGAVEFRAKTMANIDQGRESLLGAVVYRGGGKGGRVAARRHARLSDVRLRHA